MVYVADTARRVQKRRLQSGALAYRRTEAGDLQVLLVSKSRSKRWGIPKGRAEADQSLAENAAREAFEEAGVKGNLSPRAAGMFRATKRTGRRGEVSVIEVWVYLLEVTKCLSRWPEKHKRAVRWVAWDVAAAELGEPLLVELCRRLAVR